MFQGRVPAAGSGMLLAVRLAGRQTSDKGGWEQPNCNAQSLTQCCKLCHARPLVAPAGVPPLVAPVGVAQAAAIGRAFGAGRLRRPCQANAAAL